MGNLLEVDEMRLYLGDPYVINEYIKISQPTIREVIDYGEKEFFSMVHTITAIPSDFKASLDDVGIDWNEIDDFELFMLLSQNLAPDVTSILFGELDFSKFTPIRNKQNGDVVLVDLENEIMIDKLVYMRMTNYLCKAFNIKQKVEKAANATTKRVLLDEDRARMRSNKDKPFKSYLLPLISAMKVKMGLTKDYVLDMGFYEFFTDLARLQVVYNADHLLSGIYAGNVDSKSVNKSELNWLKEIE